MSAHDVIAAADAALDSANEVIASGNDLIAGLRARRDQLAADLARVTAERDALTADLAHVTAERDAALAKARKPYEPPPYAKPRAWTAPHDLRVRAWLGNTHAPETPAAPTWPDDEGAQS